MHIAINGWFVGRDTAGSGQYLHHLLTHLPRLPQTVRTLAAGPAGTGGTRLWPGVTTVPVAVPSLPGPLRKVWWEQVSVPAAARRAGRGCAVGPLLGRTVVAAGAPSASRYTISSRGCCPPIAAACTIGCIPRSSARRRAGRRAVITVSQAEQAGHRRAPRHPAGARACRLSRAERRWPRRHSAGPGYSWMAVRARVWPAAALFPLSGRLRFAQERGRDARRLPALSGPGRRPARASSSWPGNCRDSDTAFAPDPRRLAAQAWVQRCRDLLRLDGRGRQARALCAGDGVCLSEPV